MSISPLSRNLDTLLEMWQVLQQLSSSLYQHARECLFPTMEIAQLKGSFRYASFEHFLSNKI